LNVWLSHRNFSLAFRIICSRIPGDCSRDPVAIMPERYRSETLGPNSLGDNELECRVGPLPVPRRMTGLCVCCSAEMSLKYAFASTRARGLPRLTGLPLFLLDPNRRRPHDVAGPDVGNYDIRVPEQ
jgi:hypothetical protein